jgi:hypothetical protein
MPATVAVAVAVALGSASPITHASQPASSTQTEIPLTAALQLEVEVGDPALRDAISEATDAEFERLRAEHQLDLGAEAAELIVRVRIWQPEPNAVVIDAEIRLDEQAIAGQEGLVCMGCEVAELARASLTLVAEAVAEAREARARTRPPQADGSPSDLPRASEVEPAKRRARALGPVGYAGIAASGVGLGAAIVGAVFVHRGREIHGDPGAPVLDYTDYRPLGVALVGAGLGVMVVGNVLLGVDLGLLRDRRQRAGTRASVTGFGLGLAGEGRGRSGGQGGVLTIRGQF